ncbi:hypothetical protein MTO96_015256 [Rhipicephalus appendiculatus]
MNYIFPNSERKCSPPKTLRCRRDPADERPHRTAPLAPLGRSRTTETKRDKETTSGNYERHDSSSTRAEKHYATNINAEDDTEGTARGTHQSSRLTVSTAAKETVRKRPELSLRTTIDADRVQEEAGTNATTYTIDTQASLALNGSSADAVSPESLDTTHRGATQTAKGEAFETAPDDTVYGETAGKPRREGRIGEEVRVTNRLLCTVGSRAHSEEMLPPDGICDLMFYTDVVWLDGDLRGAQNQQSWKTFQVVAQTSTRTGHGLSVDYGKANDFFGSLTMPLGRQKLRDLFLKNVVHYGILKAAGTIAQLLDDMHGKLELLKLQEKFTSQVPGTLQRLDVVLGVRFDSYGDPNDSRQHSAAMTALSNHFPITIFVVHTHIEDWDAGRYPPYRNVVGLWPRWSQGSEGAFTSPYCERPKRCQHSSEDVRYGVVHTDDFTQLCKRKGGVPVVNNGLVKLYSASYNRTYAYDDAETMTKKALTFSKIYRHMCRGWAVFDTEFEDYDNTCGNGTFSRLKTFKAKLGA